MFRSTTGRARLAPWMGALALGLACGSGLPARADAPPAERTAADDAFEQLRSRLQSERHRGVEALVALLPGVRERVVDALPRAPWVVQVELLEVLARDGSAQAQSALLGHLDRTDETQAVRIRVGLVRDPAAAQRLLATYRRDPRKFLRGTKPTAQVARRRLDLVRLLERAEVERLFLSRKSKSGSTGYYKGQYDVLADAKRGPAYRDLALRVVTGIALDQAVPTPGVYTSGVYRFLRPHAVDEWELRGMATNAVAELCTREDQEILQRLAEQLGVLQEKRDRLFSRLYLLGRRYGDASKPFQDALFDWDDALGEYADMLTCIYNITPDRYYDDLVEGFLQELEDYRYPYVPIRRSSYVAAVLIRVGWYERAIYAYDRSMEWGGSRALGYYNQACAFANWSLQEGLSPGRRRSYRLLALRKLADSVKEGWSDIGWMDQDRDLDPIRDTEAYRGLLEHIRRTYRPPEDEGD